MANIDESRFFLTISDPDHVLFNALPYNDMIMVDKGDFNQIFHDELNQFGIEFGLNFIGYPEDDRYDIRRNCNAIYSSNEFPISFLKLAAIACEHALRNRPDFRAHWFIIGNHDFALSSDDRFKFYVPFLKKGYENINDVLEALDKVIDGDISHIKILHTEHFDMDNLPNTLTCITCKGKIWSPYHEHGFDMTSSLNKRRFGQLIKSRIEQRSAYIQDILKSLSTADLNRMVICRDVDGNNHLINATEISTISVEAANTQEISAKITLRNRIDIKVDLEEFAKMFADYDSNHPLELIESFNEEREVSIEIVHPFKEEVYHTMWKECINKYKIAREEKKKKEEAENKHYEEEKKNEDEASDRKVETTGFRFSFHNDEEEDDDDFESVVRRNREKYLKSKDSNHNLNNN